MKNSRAFTILEVALVTVILALMSGFAYVKYNNTVNSDSLEKAANKLYMEIRGLRPSAFKYDSWIIVKFIDSTKCGIWIDTNSNLKSDAADIYRLHTLLAPATIGVATGGPTSGWPENMTPNSSGKAGTWKDSLTIEPDSRGEYSHGAVYLKNRRLPKITYYVGISDSMQSIQLKKWDGTRWINL
jgi:hypothetical protein